VLGQDSFGGRAKAERYSKAAALGKMIVQTKNVDFKVLILPDFVVVVQVVNIIGVIVGGCCILRVMKPEAPPPKRAPHGSKQICLPVHSEAHSADDASSLLPNPEDICIIRAAIPAKIKLRGFGDHLLAEANSI
jgi:hypothetical protein